MGDITRLVADTRRFLDDRGGHASDLEDWVAVLAEFESSATGVLESTKLATGRGEGGKSRDYCEVNGSEGTLVYMLARPNEIQIGKRGGCGLETMPVPDAFLKLLGSPRDPRAGNPLVTFRYDQDVEFVQAILEQRPCRPSFADGVKVQGVMDAILESAERRQWMDVPVLNVA
jgi:predicted dehydrogenase